MSIQVHDRGKVRIIHPAGRILLGNQAYKDFERVIEAALAEGHKRIVVDLEGVKAIDSASIGMMLRYCWVRAKEKEAIVRLALAKSSPLPLHVQTCLRLAFEAFEDEVGAVASFAR